jgi:fermentation-respiration switch protein FrsA (DUF1100 family)
VGRVGRISFRGGTGDRLAGVLHLPEQDRGGVLLAHCFTCGKDLATMTRLARALTGAGYAVLRFDFTGLGESGGDFSDSHLAISVADLEAAVGVLAERSHTPIGMIGHSYGGCAAILAAARQPVARSVAVLAAPSTPGHLERLIRERDGRYSVTVNGRVFPLDEDFVADLHRHDLDRALAELGRPLLILHALDDEVVGHTEGEALFAAAHQPKAFMPLLTGGHLLGDRHRTADAARVLIDWFDRTL